MSRKPLIIISAVNFREGGPLTVLRECVLAARNALGNSWDIVALVNDSARVGVPGVEYRQYRLPARSWLVRLFYEYVYFGVLARDLQPDIWVSLHDVSPFVTAGMQVVYCHNPAPFHRVTLREAQMDWKFAIFSAFYRVFYRLNIESNEMVIVQQDWLRREFEKMCRRPRVIVAHPDVHGSVQHAGSSGSRPFVFLYPALPRVFKNFELLGDTCQILQARGVTGFEIRITISGKENAYARQVYARYGRLPTLRFIGRLNQEEMKSQYRDCHLVLFVSKLETWGLPITEAKSYERGIVAADLPYAHETVGHYDRVAFCPPDDAGRLADILEHEISGDSVLGRTERKSPEAPYVKGWAELIHLIVNAPNREQAISVRPTII